MCYSLTSCSCHYQRPTCINSKTVLVMLKRILTGLLLLGGPRAFAQPARPALLPAAAPASEGVSAALAKRLATN